MPKRMEKRALHFAKRLLSTRQTAILWCILTNLDLPIRCREPIDIRSKGSGVLGGVLVTVSLFGTTVNTTVFGAWVIQDLMPKLPKRASSSWTMGRFTKGSTWWIHLKSAGHTLFYLPAYFQDMNPIEKKWAQVKAVRRRIGGSVEALFKQI